jgi:hypothetical protein
MTKILETVIAEALPTDDRLERFRRLAKLQISRVGSFEKWAKDRELTKEQKEIAQQAYNAAWMGMRIDDCWEVLKRLTVFDEGFRLPALQAGTDEFRGNVEEKFGKLMLAVSLLTLTIQRDYEKEDNAPNDEPWLQSSNQLM